MNNNQMKKQFRQTKEWKCFREQMKEKKGGRDALTLQKLRKGWNLHHCDLDAANYRVLEESRFECLNNKSHDVVHFLFNYYKKDPSVIYRLEIILHKMVLLNMKDGVYKK